MKKMKILPVGVTMCCLLVFATCSKDSDPDPQNPNPPAGALKITGTSPEFTFWGEELTIEGSGFSTVKSENVVTFTSIDPVDGLNPTSDGGDIVITEATATKLKIRIPFREIDADDDPDIGPTIYQGYNSANIQVQVNDKTAATTAPAKFVGHPYIREFNYHYGWYDYGNVTRIADSVMLDCGFSGPILFNNAEASGYINKLRLRIGGTTYPIKRRKIGSTSGWAVYLPLNDFGRSNVTICDELTPSGDRGRKIPFEVYVEDTNIKAVRNDMYVLYQPAYSVVTPGIGPAIISKEEVQQQGTHPAWTVTGKNMFFQWATFTPSAACPDASVAEIEIANPDVFKDEYVIAVPLVLMTEDCSYTIRLKGPCGDVKEVGQVSIKP